MTTTEHYQLNTWAQEDFVSLAQMNENFTKVDAALHGRKLAGDRLHGESRRIACNQAQALLAGAKEGAHYGKLENVLLSAFLDGDDLSSFHDLICQGDLRKSPVHTGNAVWSWAADMNVRTWFGMRHIGSWTVKGWCNCELRPHLTCTNNGSIVVEESTATFYIIQNKKVLAQSEPFGYSWSTLHQAVFPLTNIDPSHPLELWIDMQPVLRPASSSITQEDIIKGGFYQEHSMNLVDTAATAVTTGNMTAVTRSVPVTGREARVCLRYTGTAPTLAWQLDGGSVTGAPAPGVSDAMSHEGTACKLAVYDLDFGSVQNGAELALHITIGEDTAVQDYCAAVI